ncbi:hypothetical protein LJ756_10735 [Arthrobacter sp. zg-Y411]|uniref:hypothetical protein n=1 Tax=Arthrobacter zhangbolii TaxID=2886936 RepID=UPI001D13F423|nr:hypothetical protein [Arthrobacter zhangbolii]MCC3295099.1 hypothetical protein [Arthrobacter zhangbolii]
MMLTVGVFFCVASLAVAVGAWRTCPSAWTVANWADLAISLLLGICFFLLAEGVNRSANSRATAVANANLITSTGVLAVNSARSLAGSDPAALRVAGDARAALQHYPDAQPATRKQLVRAVIGAYNDLAFSTFLHSDALARSVWERLREGTESVVAEADQLARGRGSRHRDEDLKSVADHLVFIELLGCALRENSGPDLSSRDIRPLPAVWDRTNLSHSAPRPGRPSESDETAYRLARFEALYQYELTVRHDWRTLTHHAAKLECDVELADLAATDDWLAPWYVGTADDSRPRPVNVLGRELQERARHDNLHVDASTPLWPQALRHGNLPEGIRISGIANLCQVLTRQPSPTICVLAYELICKTGGTARLVLDGNHRLAAARLMSMYRPGVTPRPFRVLTFLIREVEPVDSIVVGDDPTGDLNEWHGFTPDIGLIRRSEATTPPAETSDAITGGAP